MWQAVIWPAGLEFDTPVLQDVHQQLLTSLLKHGAKSLSWNSETTNAFNQLKKAFCTAATLVHPESPFLIEVDASTTGVGAVLFQRQSEPPTFHPCAFYSKNLSPAECNYNIGRCNIGITTSPRTAGYETGFSRTGILAEGS